MFTKPSRKIHRVFIHCSASDYPHHDNINTIKSWHLARGFTDIGYHFFIQKMALWSMAETLKELPKHKKVTISIH